MRHNRGKGVPASPATSGRRTVQKRPSRCASQFRHIPATRWKGTTYSAMLKNVTLPKKMRLRREQARSWESAPHPPRHASLQAVRPAPHDIIPPMRKLRLTVLIAIAAGLCAAAAYDPSLFASLQWRSIGPPRGGRSITSAGSPSRPNEIGRASCRERV